MAKKLEVREGDWIIVRLPVIYATDPDEEGRQRVTTQAANQRVTAPLSSFDVVKAERGSNWPNEEG